jgi:hypothetical protein
MAGDIPKVVPGGISTWSEVASGILAVAHAEFEELPSVVGASTGGRLSEPNAALISLTADA